MKGSNMTCEEFTKMLEKLMYPTLEYRSLEKDYDVSKNINCDLCSKCGGDCCKKCGCHFSPDDFEEISFEFLKKELEKGYISIDYVDGEMIYSDFGVYILRVRNQGADIVDACLIREKSQCILLTENGCKLDYNHRPTGGKLLIPNEDGRCRQKYDIFDCCYEWKPHQRILRDLVEYFETKEIPCSL